MKIRNIVLSVAILALGVAFLNFVSDSFSLSARLPDTGGQHHLEAARLEATGLRAEFPRRRLGRSRQDQDQHSLQQAGAGLQQGGLRTAGTLPRTRQQRLGDAVQKSGAQSDASQAERVLPWHESPSPKVQTAALPPPPPPSPTPAVAQQATVAASSSPPPAAQEAAQAVPQASPPPAAAQDAAAAQQGSAASSPPPPPADQLAAGAKQEAPAVTAPPPPALPQTEQESSLELAGNRSQAAKEAQQAAAGTQAATAVSPPAPPSVGLASGQVMKNISTAAAVVADAAAAVLPALNGSRGAADTSATAAAEQQVADASAAAGAGVLPEQNVSLAAANTTAAASGVLPAQNTSAALPGDATLAGAGSTTAAAQAAGAINKQQAPKVPGKRAYHVVATVNGNVYTEWQAIVCYHWYKKAKALDRDDVMGGFTRLLHSGRPDSLMEDIPTVVVNPLPEGIDKGYVVLNRPFAFLQWVQQYLAALEEDYVLMAEPDHIFLKPVPLWATPTKAAAFPFFYIEPKKPGNKEVIQPYVKNGFPVEKMAPIGNSPVLLHKDMMAGVVDTWYNLSLSMKQDPAAEKAFGWILEMYAFSMASAIKPGEPIQYELHPELMIQPPWDQTLMVQGKEVFILHFTYGSDYDERGVLTYGTKGTGYRFDKRDYSYLYPPLNLTAPPQNVRVPSLHRLIGCINEASAATPGWAAHTHAD